MIYGDNLLAMQALLNGDENTESLRGKIDLIYIDPPFDSKADYTSDIKLPNGGQIDLRPTVLENFAYSDTWKDGTKSYLEILYPRLCLMKELLSEQGSIYLHCDWHAGHYIKVLMDEVFGRENFVNEVVWCYKSGGVGSNTFAKKHDNIYFYSKNINNKIFNIEKEKSYFSSTKPGFKNIEIFKDENGWYSLANIRDYWNIDMIGRSASERLDYSTQKPEKLLERIIKASSNENSIVFDCFCGSGTTAAVAEKLNRRWITIDIGKPSTLITRKRLIDNNSKPFLYQTIGNYQKEMFNESKFKKVGDLSKVILNLFGAMSFNDENIANKDNLGYVKDENTLVYVDSPNVMNNKATINKAINLKNNLMGGFKNLVILGWNFSPDIVNFINDVKKNNNIKVLVIPSNLLDLLKKKELKDLLSSKVVKFSSLNYLTVKKPIVENSDTNEQKITIELENYIFVDPECLPVKTEDSDKVKEIMVNNPLSIIEYWAIDTDYDGEIFRSSWQEFRGNKNSDNEMMVNDKTVLTVDRQDKRTICVKVVDCFGGEAIAIVDINKKQGNFMSLKINDLVKIVDISVGGRVVPHISGSDMDLHPLDTGRIVEIKQAENGELLYSVELDHTGKKENFYAENLILQ